MNILKLFIFTLACAANIMIVAQSVHLPMQSSINVIRSSPFLVFVFLVCYALTATPEYGPAVLGTALYFIVESDALIDLFFPSSRVYNPYLKYKEKMQNT